MLILFIRAAILYLLVFAVIRMMGKRQICELQPFDLVFTLLIADLASNPISDIAVPLAYGAIPILSLFLIQQLIAYLSLKSEKARCVFAGKPQVVVARGVLQEETMRKAHYTINDLLEQLRAKDVFDIGDVSYAIIETDGTLSIMLKGHVQQPTIEDMGLKPHVDELAEVVILDSKIHEQALSAAGHDKNWLEKQLRLMGFSSSKDIFVAVLRPNGELQAQSYIKNGCAVRVANTAAKSAGEKHV